MTKFAVALRFLEIDFFDIISSFVAKFKNVVHSLEPDAELQTMCNVLKYRKILLKRCVVFAFIFFNLLKTSSVHLHMILK